MPAKRRGSAPTNVEIVTFVLAQLGGGERPVHLERIAQRASELAPGAFRWDLDEFSDFIDKDKVRVSLTDAEKPEAGSLVKGVGVSKRGQSKRTDLWRLTAEGASWVLSGEEGIRRAIDAPTPHLKKGRADELRRRVRSSPLFDEFQRTGGVAHDPYALTDLLECSPDAAVSVIEQRFDELQAQVRLLQEPTLLRFLSACAAANPDLLGRKGLQ